MYALRMTARFTVLIVTMYLLSYSSNVSAQNEAVERVATLSHSGYVQGASWGEGNRSILTWGDQFANIWSIEGVLLLSLPHPDNVLEARWLEGNTRIFTWSYHGIHIFSVDGMLQVEISDEGNISGYVLNHDETRIITWSYDKAVKLWDTNGQLLYTIPHKADTVQAYWNADETLIVSWDESTTIYITNVNNGHTVEFSHEEWFEQPNAIYDYLVFPGDVIISPDSQYILTILGNKLHLWTVEGVHLDTFTHDDSVDEAVWSRDSRQFISWSFDNTARLWTIDGSVVAILHHNNSVGGAKWNNDESQILTWSYDSTARIWSNEGQLLVTLSHGNLDSEGQSIIVPEIPWTDNVDSAIWNADQTRILTISSPFGYCPQECVYAAYLWNSDGELIARMSHESTVFGVSWDPDEDFIVTWSADRTAKLWDEDGNLIATLSHNSRVISAVWSADGNSLITVSEDYIVSVWHVT